MLILNLLPFFCILLCSIERYHWLKSYKSFQYVWLRNKFAVPVLQYLASILQILLYTNSTNEHVVCDGENLIPLIATAFPVPLSNRARGKLLSICLHIVPNISYICAHYIKCTLMAVESFWSQLTLFVFKWQLNIIYLFINFCFL